MFQVFTDPGGGFFCSFHGGFSPRVVVKLNAPRMRIRLDTHNNKELMPKPENVCPLFPTVLKLQEQLMKLQDLSQELIAMTACEWGKSTIFAVQRVVP